MNGYFSLIVLGLLFFTLTSCSKQKPALPLYGSPTPLNTDESPLDVICRIREEFRALPKPLMDSKTYIPSWTSRKFGAAAVEHQGFYKITLSKEGLEFLSKHSRLELVASLSPLIYSPDVGGEVAVLLAGIPVGDKSEQKSKTGNLANLIDKSNYLSPDKPRNWFKNLKWAPQRAARLYGIVNKTKNIHGTQPVNYSGSLEEKIVEKLTLLRSKPYKAFDQYPTIQPPHNKENVQQYISSHIAPTLSPKAQLIVEVEDKIFTALALYPMIYSQSLSIISTDFTLMMYLLGIEDEFWPALLNLSTGVNSINSLRERFFEQVPKQLSDICH